MITSITIIAIDTSLSILCPSKKHPYPASTVAGARRFPREPGEAAVRSAWPRAPVSPRALHAARPLPTHTALRARRHVRARLSEKAR
eukprot:6214425-Pleurochrysis_carterae.AAC.4